MTATTICFGLPNLFIFDEIGISSAHIFLITILGDCVALTYHRVDRIDCGLYGIPAQKATGTNHARADLHKRRLKPSWTIRYGLARWVSRHFDTVASLWRSTADQSRSGMNGVCSMSNRNAHRCSSAGPWNERRTKSTESEWRGKARRKKSEESGLLLLPKRITWRHVIWGHLTWRPQRDVPLLWFQVDSFCQPFGRACRLSVTPVRQVPDGRRNADILISVSIPADKSGRYGCHYTLEISTKRLIGRSVPNSTQ